MNSLRQNAYRFLFSTYPIWGKTKSWRNTFERIIQPVFDVSFKLHGANATIPSTYRYPLTIRQFSNFNNPYVELVHQVWKEKKRKLVIADIGAAVGDGLLLIQQNNREAIDKLYCLEGHKDFLKYLRINASQFQNTEIIETILSDRDEKIPALVQIHSTTASARGEETIQATTLDAVWETNNLLAPDIIKIDVDGFDLKVISGSKNILDQYKPYILFEYHPWHLLDTGNDHLSVFPFLSSSGYKKLLWFDKFGYFKSEINSNNHAEILSIREKAMLEGREPDVHFDVIAIPDTGRIDIEALKKCSFANNKPYPF
jgi:FkbM family methyltransferase